MNAALPAPATAPDRRAAWLAAVVVLGLAIGILVSLGLSRVIASQLWGVSPYDPVRGIITFRAR